ncbi:MAG: sulfotransferase [Marinicellaceae bacterium]
MTDSSKKTSQKKNTSINNSPIVIGCIGGSGSRLVSQLIMNQGYYFGDCLNKANDNLWFSLIFRRLEAVTSSYHEFETLMDIFVSKMSNGTLNSNQKSLLNTIINQPHTLAESFLKKSQSSLLNNDIHSENISTNWGWKEPNSYLFLPQLNLYFHELNYVYIIRHPLDMAFSNNQNQLKFWGKHFLGSDCKMTPKHSLKFWLYMYFKTKNLKQKMGHRLYILNYDRLVLDPYKSVKELFENMKISSSESSIIQASNIVKTPQSIGRYKNHDINEFDKKDIELLNKEKLFEEIQY